VTAERPESPQERSGRGTAQALHRAYPPDQAAEDVLGRLIEQIERLPWPRVGNSSAQQIEGG
jgi:hypothetical protein